MAINALSARGGAGSGVSASTHSTYGTATYDSTFRYDLLNPATTPTFLIIRGMSATVATHSAAIASIQAPVHYTTTSPSTSTAIASLDIARPFVANVCASTSTSIAAFRVDRYLAANTGGKGFYESSHSQNTCNMHVVPKDFTPTYGRTLREPFYVFLHMNS